MSTPTLAVSNITGDARVGCRLAQLLALTREARLAVDDRGFHDAILLLGVGEFIHLVALGGREKRAGER